MDAGGGGRIGDVLSPRFLPPSGRGAARPEIGAKTLKSRARAGSDEPDPWHGPLRSRKFSPTLYTAGVPMDLKSDCRGFRGIWEGVSGV